MYKNPLFKHSVLFGSLVGGVLVAAALTFYLKNLSINYNPNLSLINNFLIVTGVFFGVRKYRDEVVLGAISYGRAFVAGFLIIGFASFVYASFIYVLTRFFDPSIIQEAIVFAEKSLLQSGMEEKDAELIMTVYKYITPGMFAFAQWFNKVLSGLFFSLILAFFFRQNRNLYNNKTVDKFKQSKNQ